MQEKTKTPKKAKLPLGLTKAQKLVYELLLLYPNSFLVHHLKLRGGKCYRLIDEGRSPIKNFRTGVVDRMVSREYLDRNNGIITLARETK